MAARETQGSNIEQGVIARVVAGVRYAITGAPPDTWFGPSQPLPPAAQEQTEGRAFDYPVAYNLRQTPRSGETTFGTLRALADGYDLLRLVIETRKDQIKSFEWEVVPADDKADEAQFTAQIKQATEFLGRPDGEHAWDDWLSMFVEDLLVIDAVAVYPALTKGGKVHALELVDAATIARKIDAMGRTPIAPDPAYQQVLHGVPANDLSADQLVYMMRNPRTSRLYGYSPVEQVMMTVNIALRRQVSQLEFYTSGNVPEALAQVPDTWSPIQVQQFQLLWDSLNEGNTAARRKMRFMPALKDITFPKKEMLKDEYDEWLARIVCFAFSIPPTSFVKQQNRATAEQAADSAKEEGLAPLMRWLANKMTFLLNYHLGLQGIKFKWKIENVLNPEAQAKVDQIYVTTKVVTPDEVRESLGMPPLTPEQQEKAWPTPIVPEAMGPDGKPLPAVAPGQEGKKPAGEPKQGQEADKKALEAAVEKVLDGRKPQVIEFRPTVNVEVGDTVVQNVRERAA